MKLDRWDALAFVGAALVGGGVWGQFGWPWACILWGALVLAVAAFHEMGGGR